MWFHIDTATGVPIYLQLVNQVRQAVVSGFLAAGQQLPSVRDLALELTINPNTVARAYQELERAGIITTARGRGTFVAEGAPDALGESRQAAVEDFVQRVTAEARRLGLDPGRLAELLRKSPDLLRESGDSKDNKGK